MRRLNGEDSGFLALELPTQPMTSQFTAHLRLPTGPDGAPRPITLEELHAHVARRLGELPALRWRVLRVPLGLNHEVVIEDPDFRLERHLHRVVAPPPGGPAQLARISDEFASRRLDRRRPLWELVLVDGLADGRQGLLVRVHHALMDGWPTLLLLDRLLSGEDHVPVRPPEPWVPDPVPTRRQLLKAGLRDQGPALRRLPKLVRASWRGLKANKAFERDAPVAVPRTPQDSPPCRLNDAFTARRRHALVKIPMTDVLTVKRAAGVTVTMVVIALTAGALRRYLGATGDLPDKPLVSGVPMSFEKPGVVREWGNHFINFTTSLATDIDDPWERLQRINLVTTTARQAMEAFDGELLCDWLDQLPPFVTRRTVRHHVKNRRRRPEVADINVNVSVVRGPPEPWRLGRAVVDDFCMQGPPNSGLGLSVTAFDYLDTMSIGLNACADAVPDPEVLEAAYHEAMDELLEMARLRSGDTGLATAS